MNHKQIIDNIVDYAVWESSSEVWKYLGSPTLKVRTGSNDDGQNRISAGVEVLIRKLLFLTLTHINEITSLLNLKEENKVIIRTNVPLFSILHSRLGIS